MNIEQIFDHLPSALTISDLSGNIIYMNEKSQQTFAKWGGNSLIGKNLFDCHKDKSKQKMKEMLQNGEGNIYTIEKEGVKKLIYQMPWKQNDTTMGLIELSIVLPDNMKHLTR